MSDIKIMSVSEKHYLTKKLDGRACKEEKMPGCYVKARYVLALMGFLGIFNVYSLRTNLSVAIVAMVNAKDDQIESINGSNLCPDRGQSTAPIAHSNGIFDWSSADKGLALGCYFYGYVTTCLFGGWLSSRIGFKLVFGCSMLVSSVITLLTPLAAYSSFELFVAMRIFLGFLQGVSFPTMQAAWSLWAPPLERSTLMSVHFAGSAFGTCVTLPLAGVVAENLGWEAVFYYTGTCALLWSVIWFLCIHDSPEKHPRISAQEKEYILNSLGSGEKKNVDDKRRTPWVSMLTSLPLLGILTGHFASNWGKYTLLTMLPSYMSNILKLDLSQSGFLSSLPYILSFIMMLVGGKVTDMVLTNKLTSTVAIRKINTTVGLTIPALFVVLAGYIGCDVIAATTFFIVSVAFNALTVSGCKVNTLDIAPKYGGIVYGMSNTIANISGFLAPQMAGLILMDGNSLAQWQSIFWISAGVYLFGAIVYLILGSGEEQHWAKDTQVCEKDSGQSKTNILKHESSV